MANGFIELPVQSGGDKLDAESLTVAATPVLRERVQIAGAADVEIARVKATPAIITDHGLVVRDLVSRVASVQSFFASQILNATVFANSSSFDCSPYRLGLLYATYLRSSSPPNSFKVIVQFSDDGGTDWFDLVGGDITFNDALTTNQFRGLQFATPGRLMRLRLEGDGTDGSKTFTISVTADFYN